MSHASVSLLSFSGAKEATQAAGFRFGQCGVHSSRPMMLDDLGALLDCAAAYFGRAHYLSAIVDANCLAKPTMISRMKSAQHLAQIYVLDPLAPASCVLRRLWSMDSASLPLLALLMALARDPWLAATIDKAVNALAAEPRRSVHAVPKFGTCATGLTLRGPRAGQGSETITAWRISIHVYMA